MPKGANLYEASQEYLNNVADLMNARSRWTLDWQTQNQALEKRALNSTDVSRLQVETVLLGMEIKNAILDTLSTLDTRAFTG